MTKTALSKTMSDKQLTKQATTLPCLNANQRKKCNNFSQMSNEQSAVYAKFITTQNK
ncbi:hypothetical protein [Agarivorans litoreus]|uniref:hypothetical protein n=1 Tax=Agarivorans litoreus TaxID=1510455 RepID=UPI001C7D3D19|nr:hypothetical protein [Agarivorans litoreus]